MPESQESRREKTKVWEAIEEIMGPMKPIRRTRRDWRVTPDQQLSVFVTYSKGEQLFYDLNMGDLQGWLKYPYSYVVFVRAEHDDTIVMPVPTIGSQLTNNRQTKDRGNYKIHIRRKGPLEFLELPGFNLEPFWNDYTPLWDLSERLQKHAGEKVRGSDAEDTVRILREQYSIVRNRALVQKVKETYSSRCQVCGVVIDIGGGRCYAETHHVKPLGSPHNGPDALENMLCVCPNHHVQLQFGALKLHRTTLTVDPRHDIRDDYLDYHNNKICGP